MGDMGKKMAIGSDLKIIYRRPNSYLIIGFAIFV